MLECIQLHFMLNDVPASTSQYNLDCCCCYNGWLVIRYLKINLGLKYVQSQLIIHKLTKNEKLNEKVDKNQ